MDTIKPAGFWRRATALLIDCLIVGIPFWGISWLLGFGAMFMPSSPAVLYTVQFASCAAVAAYTVLFIASRWQATPGKRIMKIYIVRAEDDGRIGVSRSLGRYLVLNAAALLYMLVAVLLVPVPSLPPDMPQAERQEFEAIKQKVINHEDLTPEEQKHLESLMQQVMESTMKRMGISTTELQRLTVIQQKQRAHQELTPEEQQLADKVSEKISSNAMKGAGMAMLMVAYALLISLMIAFTRCKTGLHDIICKTRALQGTPDAPVMGA